MDWSCIQVLPNNYLGELGYLESINPPCDVDRNEWKIKALEVVVIPEGDDNNRVLRCARVRGTLLGVLSAGRPGRLL